MKEQSHANNVLHFAIHAQDLAQTRERVETHGGKISYAGEIPAVGQIISFEDTEGNILGAMQYEPEALHQIALGL